MATAIGTILRAATRNPCEPLNVLTCPTHERYQTGLAGTHATYWMVRSPQVKDWNVRYAPLPANHILLNPERGNSQLPPEIDFDVALSQNKAGQFQILRTVSAQLHMPLISLEHTLPHPSWPNSQLRAIKELRGDINVFISEYSRERWGWNPDEAHVIHHGVDTKLFSPNEMLVEKKSHALSVVNDWINRDWCCGYNLWKEATQGLPVVVVGDTPGLSDPAKSVPELVNHYREARVFINTSLISPIPSALLEAMSCGCAVVSTNNCMIPEIVTHGVNGFLANDPAEIRGYVQQLLSDENLARKLGEAARKTIVERFSLDKFVASWDIVLSKAASLFYKGAA